MSILKFLLIAILFLSAVSAADDTPTWVRDTAAIAPPKYEAKVPVVVLLNEQHVAVDQSGRRICTTRRAVRILSREGREFARGGEVYLTGTGKVRELRAWLVTPSGETRRYGKDKTADVGLVENDVYNEYRERVILAAQDADPGSVFAFEAVSEDKSIFTQWLWEFQDRLPVLTSRFVLSLPAGWRAETVGAQRNQRSRCLTSRSSIATTTFCGAPTTAATCTATCCGSVPRWDCPTSQAFSGLQTRPSG